MTSLFRKLPLILGVLAIVAGLGLALAWLRTPLAAAQAPAGPNLVLVAARPVPSGALLRPEDLAWRALAGGAPAPAGAFVQGQAAKETLVGAAVLHGLGAGEVLRAEGVVRPDQRNFLAATLGAGQRAVTISVDAPQSASGLVMPGDRVDVILVQEVAEGGRRIAAETVLRNSRVLAVGQSLTPEKTAAATNATAVAANAVALAPKTITLEASPADAERLYLASRLGDLQLALRGVGDVAVSPQGAPLWAGDVSGAASLRRGATAPGMSAAPQPTGRPHAPARPTEQPVLILRGSSEGSAS